MADKKKRPSLEDFIKKLSPGTSLRNALNYLLRARMGALIVVDIEKLSDIVTGGFKLNSRFTPQRLIEVAKMDGAIILSNDLKKIIRINALLSPDLGISTKETGSRHQAAERTAKQFDTAVIAVSERRNTISFYYGNERYELEDTSEILRKATDTLHLLEKQKDLFDEQIADLNLLEVNDIVSISDVCSILQRIEIIRRISDMIKKYLVELGKEGIIVSMRLKELTKNINQERKMLLLDYFSSRANKVDSSLQNMNFDFLIETSNLSRILFEEVTDKQIASKGIRLLGKIGLDEKEVKALMSAFGSLSEIFIGDEEKLKAFNKPSLFQDLRDLKESIISGKRI